MAGTRAGGLKTAEINKIRYGEDYYRRIGQKGGKLGVSGGFAANIECAISAGRVGGSRSKKGHRLIKETKKYLHYLRKSDNVIVKFKKA